METIESKNKNEIDILDILAVLLKHRLMIILITLITAMGVVVFSIITLKLPNNINPLPNLYTSTATILINDTSSSSGLDSILSSSGMGSLASLAGVSTSNSSFSGLAVLVSSSYTIIDTLANEFNLPEKYNIDMTKTEDFPITTLREMIKENLSVTFDEGTNTLSVSYTDTDRTLAMEIANRLTNLLEEQFALVYGTQNASELELLENKIANEKDIIASLEQDLQEFQRRNNILDVETLAAEQAVLLRELKSQLLTTNISIETYRQYSSERIQDPQYNNLINTRENLEQIIQSIQDGTSDFSQLPSQEEISNLSLEFSHIKQELVMQQTIYTQLITQYELLKLTDTGTSPKFLILEKGEIPETKSGPSRGRLSIIVTMAAFFLSILLAFLKEAWDNIKKDPDRLKKIQIRKAKQD